MVLRIIREAREIFAMPPSQYKVNRLIIYLFGFVAFGLFCNAVAMGLHLATHP